MPQLPQGVRALGMVCPYEEVLKMGLNCLKEVVKWFGPPVQEGPNGSGHLELLEKVKLNKIAFIHHTNP